jgi:uncharacterized membrane protein YhaH (DUF805 family)
MNWYFEVLKKYAVFSGRARRTEFWMFTLISALITFVLALIDGFLRITPEGRLSLLAGLYNLAVLLPSSGVSVRRLHDTGRSGWWSLIGAIPVLGWVVLLVFLAQDSQPGANQFGPNPKGAMA